MFNMQKAIAIYEKNLNYDSIIVSSCYADLAEYYQIESRFLLAFKSLYKSIEILVYTVPKNHPELAKRFQTLSTFYFDLGLIENARDNLEASLKIYLRSYEDTDQMVSN
jgi:tetratricopeptide (TPR) repeat protein